MNIIEFMGCTGAAPDLVFRAKSNTAASGRRGGIANARVPAPVRPTRYPASRPEGSDESRQACLHDLLENQTRKMAQSLHDEAGQLLAVVYLKLDELTDRLPAPQQGRVGDIRSMLSRFESELRRLSHELRPMILDDFGLLPAVEFLRKGVSERSGVPISIHGSLHGRMALTVETALYRILHELLRLACAGHARRVDITFRHAGARIECSIRQDGGDYSLLDGAMLPIRRRVRDLSGSLLTCSAPEGAFTTRIGVPLQ